MHRCARAHAGGPLAPNGDVSLSLARGHQVPPLHRARGVDVAVADVETDQTDERPSRDLFPLAASGVAMATKGDGMEPCLVTLDLEV
jgi:hypothetical protein